MADHILDTSKATITFVLDGGGLVLTAGPKNPTLRIPFNCIITSVVLLAGKSGSIVVDIWKDTLANYLPTVADSITASAKPTITSDTNSEDTILTGWTTAIAEGDILKCNIDSISAFTWCSVVLNVVRV